MRVLLDTVAWIWSVSAVDRLNLGARKLLSDPSHELFFSSASAWEIALKAALGKLQFPESPRTLVPREVARLGLRPLPVTHQQALATYDLPRHHRDPFDRLLIAQAMEEKMTILTADRVFEKYAVDVVWCGK